LEVAAEGDAIEVFLDSTPFYPEGGGQVGDRGEIIGPNGRVVVEDTQRVAERLIVHRGRVVEGRIAAGDAVTARVDPQHRADTMRNHTATHLLHAALRKVLGTHAKQAGSLVAPDHLRFDFTHTEAVSREQLAEVERLVNEKVRQNLPVHTRLTSFDDAMSEGVLAFFGEKYGEEVRVVEVNTVVPRFSAELCGGTHCERTGDVGLVLITGESSIGAGMRRIEALSGRSAENHVREKLGEIEEALRRLGGARGALPSRIDALVAERDALAKRVERMERSLASAPAVDQIAQTAVDVDGVKVLASQVDLPSVDALRYRADALRKTMPSGVAVLGTVIDGRPQFVATVSPDVISKGPKAGDILKRVAAIAGGGGGGRPEMAQGGGKDPSKIGAALAIVPDAVREMLSGDASSGRR
jgi:alanyl-tRNA synthetase